MRLLSVLVVFLLCLPVVQAADPPGTFALTMLPTESKTVPGFVTLISQSTVWDVEATHIISVHRTKENPDITYLVIDVPLTQGDTHTRVMIHRSIMTHENVLRFVQDIRFKPRQQ